MDEINRITESLSQMYPEFGAELNANPNREIEEVLPPASSADIESIETRLGIPLPKSYKALLQTTRGFHLLDGVIQFSLGHPFFPYLPRVDEFSTDGQPRILEGNNGWPIPSYDMLFFAEYWRDADGDGVFFDVSDGLINGEYPVCYYCHEKPPTVERLADSFDEWLNEKCIQQMKGEDS